MSSKNRGIIHQAPLLVNLRQEFFYTQKSTLFLGFLQNTPKNPNSQDLTKKHPAHISFVHLVLAIGIIPALTQKSFVYRGFLRALGAPAIPHLHATIVLLLNDPLEWLVGEL